MIGQSADLKLYNFTFSSSPLKGEKPKLYIIMYFPQDIMIPWKIGTYYSRQHNNVII